MKKIEEDLLGSQPSSKDLSEADLEKLRRQHEEETAHLLSIFIKPYTPPENDGLGR
jgi:hypothetical protein